MEVIEILASIVSALSAAIAAFFAYKTIKENRRSIFAKDKYQLAMAVRDVYFLFQSKGSHFKISEYGEHQRIMLSSKYFVSPELYENLNRALSRLHKFERAEISVKREDFEEVLSMLNDIQCDRRLD